MERLKRLASKVENGVVAFALIAVAAPAAGFGQFAQYTAPGAQIIQTETRRSQVESALAGAKWQFGGLRVDPWFGLRDVSLVDSRSSESGASQDRELTASAGVGLRAYLPLGGKTTLAAFGLPEYRWFEKRSENSGVQGRLGAGLFSYFNRLHLEVSAERAEGLNFASLEDPRRVEIRLDTVGFKLALPLTSRFEVFGEVEERGSRYDPLAGDEDLAVRSLDRDDTVVQAGIRWKPTPILSLGLGGEWTESSFLEEAGDRSNSGFGPRLEVALKGARTLVAAEIVLRDLEGEAGSQFGGYDDVTWAVQLGYEVGGRTTLQAYSRNKLVYSVDPTAGFFEENRFGIGARWESGDRLSFDAFAEEGTEDFFDSTTQPGRRDDVRSVGVGLRLRLAERLNVRLSYERSDFDSNLDDRDREFSVIGAGIQWSGGGGGGQGAWW